MYMLLADLSIELTLLVIEYYSKNATFILKLRLTVLHYHLILPPLEYDRINQRVQQIKFT